MTTISSTMTVQVDPASESNCLTDHVQSGPVAVAADGNRGVPVRHGADTQTGQPEQPCSTWGSSAESTQRARCVQVTGLAKWEGKIVEIDGDTFTAELFPLEREGMPITADFALDLLGSDAGTVECGDVFYLSVRTVREPGKRPSRTESLRLRRLGRITPDEVRAAYAKADALMGRLEQLSD